MGDALTYLVYSSIATVSEASPANAEIVQVAAARNARLGVTGFLHREEDMFFQCLEGPETAIEEVWASIRRDPRHREVTLLVHEPLDRRRFAQWSMGFTSRGRVSLFDWMVAQATSRMRRDDPATILSFLVNCSETTLR